MEKIRLANGKETIVDKRDYEELSKYKWHFSDGYAIRYGRTRKNGVYKGKDVRMHRQILNAPKNMVVDHINRDRLDNRRSNLRLCTPKENARNSGLSKNNTSGYKGVFLNPQTGRWRARIKVNYKFIYLGTFDCIHDAARAYNNAALKYHREFASLNKIKQPPGRATVNEV